MVGDRDTGNDWANSTKNGGTAAPIERIEFSAISEDAVEEFIRQTYADNSVKFLSVPADARFDATTVECGELAADLVRCTIDYSTVIEPIDYAFFLNVRGGRVQMRNGREETILGAGESTVYPLGVALAFDTFDLDGALLRLPIERLQQTATELSGIDGSDLRLDGTTPVTPAAARRWSAVMAFANEAALDEDSVFAHPLLAEETMRTVAVTALHTFPNSAMRAGLVESRQPATPATIRRATAFIEANADTPISVTDIAAAAAVTPRALQYGFQRHLDTTPMAYLRRVRLEAAHYDLQDADPGDENGVAEIGRRWGFANPGRFAGYYRETYGLSPSETLRS